MFEQRPESVYTFSAKQEEQRRRKKQERLAESYGSGSLSFDAYTRYCKEMDKKVASSISPTPLSDLIKTINPFTLGGT